MKREFFVAGVQFRPSNVKDEIKKLNKGQYLYLELEPDNKFDPNAVKILCNGLQEGDDNVFLGYVPKKFSSEVAALLEARIELECVVDTVNKEAKTWEMLKVIIKTTDEIDEAEDEDEDSIL
jgi:hypothetical protein